jgi:hypothetical protein
VTTAFDPAAFRDPSREFGILPFWFLNGELDPEEMRYQLRELREKDMAGVILHGRFGLEMPYIGDTYLERIRFAVEEAGRLGLQVWIYDEMNWPSGTADKRVLAAHPDLAERYLECLSFEITGPWFMYLTGADSRYLNFERSTPVAAFALGEDGTLLDLTRNLSFENVVPWEVPPGRWRLMYLVEKRADYYIDALDPASTEAFLRIGYQPYLDALGEDAASKIVGFYSDEPAMHYFLSGGDNAIVPWTRDLFRRFQERNGYDLRPRLPDLFFDIADDTAKVRHDFYESLTDFYTNAYYGQIQRWCHDHGVRFTAHLLYEEWLRRMVRVEGNLFRHYEHMDVVAVDHLYPIVGTRTTPDQHVAMKVASSAAHHVGSERLICESFGGIFMDATMQRMKWVADWEYVLGVNVLNPHGFHYTLEGPRKRDWPPSMFYQYPWWTHYVEFSRYIERLSQTLSGGCHVAQAAVLWPINSMFATYTPQVPSELGDRIERDFNALTDALLRLHLDFDYLDEDVLARAEIVEGRIRVAQEEYELLVVPPMSHVKLPTVPSLERFIRQGGRVLAVGLIPSTAFGDGAQHDVTGRMNRLFDLAPANADDGMPEVGIRDHEEGRTAFVRAAAIAGRAGADPEVMRALRTAIDGLVDPDVGIDNDEIFSLHRRTAEGQDVYFMVNPTHEPQEAVVDLRGRSSPGIWDPATGGRTSSVASWSDGDRTRFRLTLPPVGSAFVIPEPVADGRVTATDVVVEGVDAGRARGYAAVANGFVEIARNGLPVRISVDVSEAPEPLALGGSWGFEPLGANGLVISRWLTRPTDDDEELGAIADPEGSEEGWLPVGNGAWGMQVPGTVRAEYPQRVWYRIRFTVDEVPTGAELLIDGFAGGDRRIVVNGVEITAAPRRSDLDGQILALPVGEALRVGENVMAVGLTLSKPTDGILDLVKIVGPFSIAGTPGAERIAGPRDRVDPAPWTAQGYPYLSARATYRRSFDLPERFAECRVFLETPMIDDTLLVSMNGVEVGVRLWEPYEIEVTDHLLPGENVLELTVANTPVNLLGGVARPSGIARAPTLVAYRPFDVAIDADRPAMEAAGGRRSGEDEG